MQINARYDTDHYEIADKNELDALREAVEVLEGAYAAAKGDAESSERYADTAWRCNHDRAVRFDEFAAAAREAVEVLEDMYAQRDAEAERWFEKWLHAFEGKSDWEQDAHYFEALSEDYARRLKAADEAFRKLSASRDYTDERVKMLRERIKTYKATLQTIADAKSHNGAAILAFHVLNSDIRDGGSDF